MRIKAGHFVRANINTMRKQEVLEITLPILYGKLETSEQGLTDEEARRRLEKYGRNILQRKNIRAIDILFRQFKNSLVYLLVAAGLIAYGVKDYSDGTIIFIILALNTLLGFYQEYKSEKIVERLSRFLAKQVKVKRNSQVIFLDEPQIAPGDVVIVQEGDIVPADIRLIEAENLQVNESQLTGESFPAVKSVAAGLNTPDQSLLFTGSVIEKGSGVGVVYATGSNTELGGLAKIAAETEKQTQYEKSLQSFSWLLVRIALVGLTFVFLAKFFFAAGRQNPTDLLLFIIALAVAAVPEALPVIATVALSKESFKLAKSHVVVRRLSAMEDLGNINMLCTDKTGTITENKMTVKKIVSVDERLFQIFSYIGTVPLGNLSGVKRKRIQNSYGDSFSHYLDDNIKNEARHFKVLKEFSFDPEDRRSRLVIKDEANNKYFLVSIGAPEVLLAISNEEDKDEHLRLISQEGKNGLLHLAIAYKEVFYDAEFDILKNERDLIFLGYASLEDLLRPTAKSAIEHAERLGVKIKILTGDSKEVAEYVGKQIGLIKDGDAVCEGSELGKMSPDDFSQAVFNCNVFARLTPVQKFNIINELKKNYVVAYQGDGINDALALKTADVAIAVDSATDIAKESADIVLLSKSLEIIINGIKYGRAVFVNINKYIKYAMSNNFGVFVGLSVLYLFSVNLPILPVQMLLNNLIGDIPLTMISTDSVENDEVARPEKHNVKNLVFVSFLLGIPTALFEILYFVMIKKEAAAIAQTSLYVFFTFQALIIFYAVRNKDHFWKAKAPPFFLNMSFLSAFVFSLAVIYVPRLQTMFSFVPLPVSSIGIIFGLMVFYFIAVDYLKAWAFKEV